MFGPGHSGAAIEWLRDLTAIGARFLCIVPAGSRETWHGNQRHLHRWLELRTISPAQLKRRKAGVEAS